MKIAVDIDDTLNIARRLELGSAYIERKGLPFQVKDPYANKLVEVFDWTSEDALHFVREEGGAVIYTDAEARKGAREALAGWRALGHKIVILTARDKEWFGNPERVSRDWLEKRRIPYDEIVADVPLNDKGAYCLEHGIPVLIDDDPVACMNAQNRGIMSVLAIGRHNAAVAPKIRYGGANWKQIDAAVKHIFAVLQANRG